jgi:hypothetical protein
MSRLLDIDTGEFARRYGGGPMAIRHSLGDHRLLTVEAVAELADDLPAGKVEHNAGALPSVLPGGEAPRSELSPGEIARGIERNGQWMVLKNIELSPAYRQLLDETLDEVAPLVEGREGEGGMTRREGFIFLSAPGSVTPSHLDPEHNFLLQVRGTKDMHVGRFASPEHEQRELERYYHGGHRNIDRLPDTAETYHLSPGDGVYVPVHAPHWVANGPHASVSLSITWYTPAVEQAGRVHAFNGRLRRLRLAPRPPGRRPGADRGKALAQRSLSGLTRIARVRRD